MLTQNITIKGIRDGLQVTLGDNSLPDLLKELAQRLLEQGEFFRGGQVALLVGNRELNTADLDQLADLFAEQTMTLRAVLSENEKTLTAARALNLGTRLSGSNTELVGSERKPEPPPPQAPTVQTVKDSAGDGMLVRGALRSGRLLESSGHVVVIGDVNPGAEIVAGGDVIVWGKLRGLVHAGAYGDQNAVVCALELVPTQLRIAQYISVSPGGPRDKEPVPEMASVKNAQIVAESWSPGYRG